MLGREVGVGGVCQLRGDRAERGHGRGRGAPLRGGHRVVAPSPGGEHGIATRHPAGLPEATRRAHALGVGPQPVERGRGSAQLVDLHGEPRDRREHANSVPGRPISRGRRTRHTRSEQRASSSLEGRRPDATRGPPTADLDASARPFGQARSSGYRAYAAQMTRTARLTLGADGRLRHRIPSDQLSNDLAGWIADDLVGPGLILPDAFERTFVSVVGSAWLPFYRNTLRELANGGSARRNERRHGPGARPRRRRWRSARSSSWGAASASSPCGWPATVIG